MSSKDTSNQGPAQGPGKSTRTGSNGDAFEGLNPGASKPRKKAVREDELAVSFADRHADTLRYVDAWGKWLVYDGKVWTQDNQRVAQYLARQHCRELAPLYGRDAKMSKASVINAVLSLATSDPRLRASADQWDADLMLLNTPGGVVDLRTGEMLEHRADRYLTKCTAIAPENIERPLFDEFLSTIFQEDQAVIEYLWRRTGYCLTGMISEQCMFFDYGAGANGKTVLINTLAGVMGDYHKTSPIEVFIDSDHPQHPTGLARLKGARFVTATETKEGRKWDEAMIKRTTGGDVVNARFMHNDWFEFTPQFKLLAIGNHKPGLNAADLAIGRRMRVQRYEVTIDKCDQDKELAAKLRQEWPAILSRAIAGAVEWFQLQSLEPPANVTQQTNDYLASEDSIAAWLEEKCTLDPNERTPLQDLFASWKAWCDANGMRPGTSTRFANRLEMRGFARFRSKATRGHVGLAL